jgi:hypothetical protein
MKRMNDYFVQPNLDGSVTHSAKESAIRFLASTKGLPIPTVSSVSGGKSSAYMAIHNPTDYYVFALVLSDDKKLTPKSKSLADKVRDRIPNFIASLEVDETLEAMFWLEEKIGKTIHWVAAPYTFEEMMARKSALPSFRMRFCTEELKVKPIYDWCVDTFGNDGLCQMNIGYRYGEEKRVFRRIGGKYSKAGGWDFSSTGGCERIPMTQKKREWRIFQFPLYDDGIDAFDVFNYFQNESVTFPKYSNCAMCFNKRPTELQEQSRLFPERAEWVHRHESMYGHSFSKHGTLSEIVSPSNPLLDMDDSEHVGGCDECTD